MQTCSEACDAQSSVGAPSGGEDRGPSHGGGRTDTLDRRAFRRWLRVYAAWSAVGLLNMVLGGPGGALTLVMLQAMSLGGVVASMIHESGHVLVARLCDATVPEVTVGLGRPIARLQFGGTVLSIGRYPVLGGLIRMSWREGRVGPWRVAAVALAGPVANLGAAVLLAAGAWLATPESVAQAMLAGLSLAQLAAGVFNLLPAPASQGYPATDGAQALAALVRRDVGERSKIVLAASSAQDPQRGFRSPNRVP